MDTPTKIASRSTLGKARFDPLDAVLVDGRRFEVTSVSMGNPHCVVIVPDLAKIDVHALGPKIERHPAFPKRTNVQVAQVVSRTEVWILIWERGAGYTLASMPGGQLRITIADDGEIRMRGPVEEICTGDLSPDLLRRLGAV